MSRGKSKVLFREASYKELDVIVKIVQTGDAFKRIRIPYISADEILKLHDAAYMSMQLEDSPWEDQIALCLIDEALPITDISIFSKIERVN